MSDKLKNIIKKSVNILLEVDIADLPQKQVVKDKGAYNLAKAQATLDNIDKKFREIGITVNQNEMATLDILKSMQPFTMKFKLEKSTPFFDGQTSISGKAKIDDRHKGLRLFFISDDGHKVRIDFERKDLNSKQPQTGGDVVALLEETYVVQLSHSKSGIMKGEVEIEVNGKKVTVSGKRLGKIYFLESNKGITYTVAANPDKQDGVIEGQVNVTLVGDESDPQPNKSFAVPKRKLEKTPEESEYAYFPKDGGKPQRVDAKVSNQPYTTKIHIESLPDVRLDADKSSDVEFELGKPVHVKGELTVNGKLNFKNNITLDNIKQALEKGVSAVLADSDQENNVVKLAIGNDKVVMLKPKGGKNPKIVGNWNNMPVKVGSKALGNEEWTDTSGEVTLNVVNK
jgi:hypothetical protein